jgi:hypothetical protein
MLVGGFCTVSMGMALAEESQGEHIAPGVQMTTPVSVGFLYDDNVYRTPNNEKSATAYLIRPGVNFAIASGASQYSLGYSGEVAEYDSGSRDDYFDNTFDGSAKIEMGSRHHIDLDAEYKMAHDAFGEARTAGTPASNRDLDKWNLGNADLQYTFGALTAPFNLSLRAGEQDKEYSSNRTDTKFLDYSKDRLGAGALYRLSPKTALTLDYDHYDINYDHVRVGSTKRDGEIQEVLAGAKWAVTAKTVGYLKVGYYSRDFDASSRKDVDGIDWIADIAWSPRSYSTFVLETGRLIRESYFDNEDFINTQLVGVKWQHDWSGRTKSNLGVTYYDLDFVGGTPHRQEENWKYQGELSHALTRLWTAKVGFETNNRDSNVNSFDYDKNVVYVGLDGTF